MKIAVTYEGGSIFQHFGKTETFKMYEVEDGKITSMQIVHAGGAGHSALAGFLSEQSANVLICGGIGEGAQDRKSTRLNSSHPLSSRMPSSA